MRGTQMMNMMGMGRGMMVTGEARWQTGRKVGHREVTRPTPPKFACRCPLSSARSTWARPERPPASPRRAPFCPCAAYTGVPGGMQPGRFMGDMVELAIFRRANESIAQAARQTAEVRMRMPRPCSICLLAPSGCPALPRCRPRAGLPDAHAASATAAPTLAPLAPRSAAPSAGTPAAGPGAAAGGRVHSEGRQGRPVHQHPRWRCAGLGCSRLGGQGAPLQAALPGGRVCEPPLAAPWAVEVCPVPLAGFLPCRRDERHHAGRHGAQVGGRHREAAGAGKEPWGGLT